ncbi:MAG TPA: hypothetical protein EYN91_26455 [Candidatus Melainabacteria bacterium]|nr:hypothetical protein [Candidatus Melainabacteria bacterium]HIN63717.1 hypothetical protein [Candidatus Obscuribacterales bacterium]
MSFETAREISSGRNEVESNPFALSAINDFMRTVPRLNSTISRTDSDQQEDLDKYTTKAALENLYAGIHSDISRAAIRRTEQAERPTPPTEKRDKQQSEIEDDLRKYGRQPLPVLTQLMKDNRVVAIADSHTQNDSQRLNAPDILRSLKEGGATHLVIEAPASTQEVLDKFNNTGNLDVTKLPSLLRDPAYVNMLKSARESGLKIVAGDAETGMHLPRNAVRMASTIKHILDQPNQDPNKPNKVALWAGTAHVHDYSPLRQQGATANPTAVEVLKKGNVQLVTVNQQSGGPESPVTRAAMNLRLPEIVSTSFARHIGAYSEIGIPLKVEGDQIIFYPSRRK